MGFSRMMIDVNRRLHSLAPRTSAAGPLNECNGDVTTTIMTTDAASATIPLHVFGN
jgi:hypothetical protein